MCLRRGHNATSRKKKRKQSCTWALSVGKEVKKRMSTEVEALVVAACLCVQVDPLRSTDVFALRDALFAGDPNGTSLCDNVGFRLFIDL